MKEIRAKSSFEVIKNVGQTSRSSSTSKDLDKQVTVRDAQRQPGKDKPKNSQPIKGNPRKSINIPEVKASPRDLDGRKAQDSKSQTLPGAKSKPLPSSASRPIASSNSHPLSQEEEAKGEPRKQGGASPGANSGPVGAKPGASGPTSNSGSLRPKQPTPRRASGAPASKKPASEPGAPIAQAKSSSKYIPALDGLRAFAVIAVVIYHMVSSLLPGGLLGVTIFFVLSGYLITGILIREWNKTEKIDLPRFWIHRVRRLFPAIFFMICSVLVITALLRPDLLTKLRNDLFPALFWFTNWWYIFQDVSYFEAMGAPSPVNHFWSLAIEEQFYVIWPPLLLLLFKSKAKKGTIQNIILVLAVVSVVLMAVLYVPGGDPSRVYYGTDTRAFSLLIGAFLAFVFPAHRIRGHGRQGLNDSQRKAIGVIGMVCCIAIVVVMVVLSGYSPIMYYGGILAVSLLTGGLILALVDPGSAIARFFSLRPLVYIGKISYGIYIWHYPIILLMTDFNSTVDTPFWWFLLEAAVVLGVSAFSYHFVEQPIRQGRLGEMWHAIKDKTMTWGAVIGRHIVQLLCALALVVGSVVACIVTPYTTTQSDVSYDGGSVVPEGVLGTQNGEEGQDEAAAEAQSVKEYLISRLGTNPALEGLSVKTLEQLVDTPGANATEKAHDTSFILIGDSVSAAFTSEYYGDFSGMFPNAILDAMKNRTISQGIEVLQDFLDQGWDGPVVIYELGTNVRSTKEDIEAMVAAVPEGKMIFLVNIRANVDHMTETNNMINEVAWEHPNVGVIDWHAVSSGHNEYFSGDGTHLTGDQGAPAFQNMLLYQLETLYKQTDQQQTDQQQTD